MPSSDTKMVRIPASLHKRLTERASLSNTTLAGVISQTLKVAEEFEFWAELDRTMTGSAALAETASELAIWQPAAKDGLSDDETFDWNGLA
jgi:hypothetical protein